jgi:hypothetical protein
VVAACAHLRPKAFADFFMGDSTQNACREIAIETFVHSFTLGLLRRRALRPGRTRWSLGLWGRVLGRTARHISATQLDVTRTSHRNTVSILLCVYPVCVPVFCLLCTLPVKRKAASGTHRHRRP